MYNCAIVITVISSGPMMLNATNWAGLCVSLVTATYGTG